MNNSVSTYCNMHTMHTLASTIIKLRILREYYSSNTRVVYIYMHIYIMHTPTTPSSR